MNAIEEIRRNQLLRETSVLQEYLTLLKAFKNELIVFAVKDTPGYYISDMICGQMKELGLTADIQNNHQCAYIGVINDGIVTFEKVSAPYESISNELYDNGIYAVIKSAAYFAANRASVIINGNEYAINNRGLNIVVYSKENQYLIDSVCFDTHDKKLPCLRNFIRTDICSNPDLKIIKKVSFNKVNEDRRAVYVRLVWSEGLYSWNVYKSIARSFADDEKVDFKVIIYGQRELENRKKLMVKERIAYTVSDEYDVASDTPNILIMSLSCDWVIYKQDDIIRYQQYSEFIVSVPVALVKVVPQNIRDHLEKFVNKLSSEIDYFVFDRLIYREIEEAGISEEKFVEIGNPKFDEIYNWLCVDRSDEIPEEWLKFTGKKVILWTTDHVFWSANVSFEQYFNYVVDYFENNNDVALMFRPHPALENELILNGIYTRQEIRDIKNKMKSSANMIWDDRPDYGLSYYMADAIIADPNCGIVVSALCTKKPLAAIFRYEGEKCIPAHPAVISHLYNINSLKDYFSFVSMVKEEKDPMQNERIEMMNNVISHFDGKNGKRIKEFVMEKYNKKCKDRIL